MAEQPSFFSKNKFLIITGSAILLLVIILIAVYASMGMFGSPISKDAGTTKTNPSELLPQTQRTNTIAPKSTAASGKITSSSQPSGSPDKNQVVMSDPFSSGPITLMGVIMSNNKNNVAIIENGDSTFIVKEGEMLLDYWKVEKIEKASVTLKAGKKILKLELYRKKKAS